MPPRVPFSTTITLRPNGSMTVPKKWREKHPTPHYIAEETPKGLLLRPLRDEDIEYWEKDDGSCGLHFPSGIDAGVLATMFREAIAKIEAEDAAKKRRKKAKRSAAHNG